MIRQREDGIVEMWAQCSRCGRAKWIPERAEMCARCRQRIEHLFDVVTAIAFAAVLLLFGAAIGSAVAFSVGDLWAFALCVLSIVSLFSAGALVWAVSRYLD